MDTWHYAPRPPVKQADLLVFDRDDRRLLLVEVRVQVKSPEVADTLRGDLDAYDFPFGMLVDRNQILVFSQQQAGLVLAIPTADVLTAYHPEFHRYRLTEEYLQNMLEGWLADFAISWKSEDPPHAQGLMRIGLADRLRRCTIDVKRELRDGTPLHRDELPDELRFWS